MTQSPASPATACAVSQQSFFDAVSLLGLGPAYDGPMPEVAPGEIAIRMPEVSLRELRDNPVAQPLLWKQDWYDKYPWAAEKLPCGIYVLRLPVPQSNHKTFDQQSRLLLPGEEPANIVLAATAMLSIRLTDGNDSLSGQWFRCKEQTSDGLRVGLEWLSGQLDVGSDWNNERADCNDRVWMAATRKIA
jgi:hypothetical protein